MLSSCYLCGNPATKKLSLKDTFTAHSLAKCPDSDKLCNRCHWAIPLRCWYFNPGKSKWNKLFSRNWSWLFQDDTLIAPKIEGEHTEGKDTFAIVSELPTRANIRQWILEPPEPPFTIAIAESGQKHILPWAQQGLNRDRFPVQFEIDSLMIDRGEFDELIKNYESLMNLDFGKGEIDSGNYRSEKLIKCLNEWEPLESIMARHRGSRLLQLVSYVAILM